MVDGSYMIETAFLIPLLWRGGENSEEFLTGWFKNAKKTRYNLNFKK
jgi:hypothetical protein